MVKMSNECVKALVASEASEYKAEVENHGWSMLTVDSLEVRDNVNCQLLALLAGSTVVFFAAYSEFAKSMVAMPVGDGEDGLAELKRQAVEAFKGTFAFTINFSEAIQTLGLLPGGVEVLDTLLEMERDSENKPLNLEEILETVDIPALLGAIEFLTGGAEETVGRANAVLAEALTQQGKGQLWEAMLTDQQAQQRRVEGLRSRLAELENSPEYLERVAKLERLQQDLPRVVERIAATTRDLTASVEDLKSRNSVAISDIHSLNKQRQEQWEKERDKVLGRIESHINSLEAEVRDGGLSYEEEEVEDNWLWPNQTHLVKKRNMDAAVKALKMAQEEKKQLEARWDDSKRPSEKTVEVGNQFAWLQQHIQNQKAEVAALEEARQKMNETIEETTGALEGQKQAMTTLSGELAEEVKVLEERSKALNAELEAIGRSGMGHELTQKVITAYQKGQMLQEALHFTALAEKNCANSLKKLSVLLKTLFSGIAKGGDAEDQMQRLRKIQALLQGEDPKKREMALPMMWLSKVAGKYVPMPAPEGITKKMVIDARKELVADRHAALEVD